MYDIIPVFNVEEIILRHYNNKIKEYILCNLKNYSKLKKFDCSRCNLNELPNLPISLIQLICFKNNLIELPNTFLISNSLILLDCGHNKLIVLPDLPNSLILLDCDNNTNLNLVYHDFEIKTINETNKINLKNKINKRMKLLNRTLLLEHSARITLHPKRILRLLDNQEINFFDGSFVNI